MEFQENNNFYWKIIFTLLIAILIIVTASVTATLEK